MNPLTPRFPLGSIVYIAGTREPGTVLGAILGDPPHQTKVGQDPAGTSLVWFPTSCRECIPPGSQPSRLCDYHRNQNLYLISVELASGLVETVVSESELMLDPDLGAPPQEVYMPIANSETVEPTVDPADPADPTTVPVKAPTEQPLDSCVRSFLELAMDPKTPIGALRDALQPVFNAISFSLVGPLWGCISGMMENGRLPDGVPGVETMLHGVLESIIDRPGYNDFLMAKWKMTHNPSLVKDMLDRTLDEDFAISSTAMWMINSVAEQDPEFKLQLDAATAVRDAGAGGRVN